MKQRHTGLFVAIGVAALVVVIVGVAGGILLSRKSNTPSASAGGKSSATATSSAPSGFQQFKNSTFSIRYPTDWKTQGAPVQGGTGEMFNGPAGSVTRSLSVDVSDSTQSPKKADDTGCLLLSGNPQASATTSMVMLGGQEWTREECATRNILNARSLKGVVESVIYKGKLYTISYDSSPADTFTTDRSKYYTPMEQSFMFLT